MMANLGICKGCSFRGKIKQPTVDATGRKLSSAQVWCNLPDSLGLLEWDTEVPDSCPFRMEHLITTDDIADLAEESVEVSRK